MGDEDRNYDDRRIEALLRARADAEPRAGLEERVLARIANEPPRRVFARWPMFAAVGALVVIAIALIILRTETPKQHLAVQNPQQENPAKPSQDKPTFRGSVDNPVTNREARKHPRRDSRDQAHRGNGNEEQLPKLATFPAPRPETEQERMLIRLAARIHGLDGTEDSMDVAQLQNLSVPEFNIHPMEVEPPVNDSPQQ